MQQITQVEIDNFLRFYKAGIGFDDEFNLKEYSMSYHEAKLIESAFTMVYGPKIYWPEKPNLHFINIHIERFKEMNRKFGETNV